MYKDYWKVKKNRWHFDLDTDRDRVPDWKDCKPFDSKYQHISKTTKKRIEDLNISVSYEKPSGEYARSTLTSKEAKRMAPKTVQEVYSTFKRHPQLLGEIERTKQEWEKRPTRPAFLNKEFTSEEQEKIKKEPYYTAYSQELPTGRLASSTGGSIATFTIPEKTVKEIQKESEIPLKRQDIIAHGLYHELAHEQQYLRDPKMQQKSEAYLKKHVPNTQVDISSMSKKERYRLNKLYYSNPYEAEAERIAQEKLKKRLQPIPEEDIYTGYRTVID